MRGANEHCYLVRSAHRLADALPGKSVKERGVESKLDVHGKTGSLQGEFRRLRPGAEQRGAVQGSGEKEMNGRTRARSGKLDFKRGHAATVGLERRVQGWTSRRCDREGLEANEAGLFELHRDHVAILRKPRRLRLKRGERTFTEFLKPRKRLVHRNGRFPANQKGGGGRKPRGSIRLP